MPGEIVNPAAPAAAGAQPPAPTGNAGATPAAGAEQPKPSDLMAELGAVFKKHGGIKYKSNSKEVVVDDPALLVRRLQNVDGLEASANELLKLKNETKHDREMRDRLKTEKNPIERVKILRELYGEEFDSAAEVATLERFERERAKDKLTPGERKLQDQLEQERQAREKLEREQNKTKTEREQQELQEATQQLAKQLFTATAQAFQKIGIKPDHAERYIPEVAAYLSRASQLKLDVSLDSIIEHVTSARDGENSAWLESMSDEALLDRLEKMVEQGEGKPGLSRAKRLANLMAKRALTQITQAPNTGTSSIIPNGQKPAQAPAQGEKPPSYWNTVRR